MLKGGKKVKGKERKE